MQGCSVSYKGCTVSYKGCTVSYKVAHTSPAVGGFGFNEAQIGMMLATVGPLQLASQLCMYPSIVKRYGPRGTFLRRWIQYTLV
jgi:hypothetical protein